MRLWPADFVALLVILTPVYAQFGSFFDQVFGGGQQHQQHHQPRNVPSSSEPYRHNYETFYCDKYLCPDTLACVHFPHHCPCPWPDHQDKFEMGEGGKICISKSGFQEGEVAHKVELARKGML